MGREHHRHRDSGRRHSDREPRRESVNIERDKVSYSKGDKKAYVKDKDGKFGAGYSEGSEKVRYSSTSGRDKVTYRDSGGSASIRRSDRSDSFRVRSGDDKVSYRSSDRRDSMKVDTKYGSAYAEVREDGSVKGRASFGGVEIRYDERGFRIN